MEITYRQKKVKIKANLIQNARLITTKAEEGEGQVQLLPERNWDHLHAEEDEDQVQLTPEHHGGHIHEYKGRNQVQLTPGHHGGHPHAEDDKGRPSWRGVEARALRNFACSF